MLIVGMVVGTVIFSAGVIVGTRLDLITKQLSVSRSDLADKLRRKSPLEGKNGMLSYRNLRLRSTEDDDE
jgi:hypothetical protein